MRNYIKTFWGITNFSNAFHVPQAPIYSVEGDATELALELQLLEQSLADNGFTDISSTLGGQRYFLLDKTNVLQMVGAFADYWYTNPTVLQYTGDSTPRNGWTDAAGVKREPPPSEKAGKEGEIDTSGAQTLIENFLSIMETLIKSYSSKGDKRTVGILKFELREFLDGQKSVTQILDELRKLFII